MTKKEFKKEFKKHFKDNTTRNGYEIEIIIFLTGLELEFDILDLSEENDYWYEVRTGITKGDRYFSIIFNHDFQFLLDEYDVDELWELVQELRKEAKKVQKIFNN